MYRYLLKPITKAVMSGVLAELQKKLESENEMKDYLRRFKEETQEYEQYSRRRFFEQLAQGKLSPQEIYEAAAELEMDISASAYNIVMFTLYEPENGAGGERDMDAIAELQVRLVQYAGSDPDYLLFRWNLTTHAILIKGTPESIAETTARCVEHISRRCGEINSAVWHIAAGEPVERLSAIPVCFSQVSRLLSYGYLCPHRHILTEDCIDEVRGVSDDMESCAVDPEQIKSFLANGEESETDEFVSRLLCKISDNVLESFLFCQYLCMTVCFTAAGYIESIGGDDKRLPRPDMDMNGKPGSAEAARDYVRRVLHAAIEMRRKEESKRYRDMLRQALTFIDENYADEELSLNRVAREVNVSPNYFSAVFSQQVGQTFIEYLTQQRMNEACRLLKNTELRSSEIAAQVGYKDAHYFSFLFKKTQGCTPRDYRGGAKQ